MSGHWIGWNWITSETVQRNFSVHQILRAQSVGWHGEDLECHFWHTSWRHLSLGLHVDVRGSVEIHLPFGFLRVGRNLNVMRMRGFLRD